MTSGATPPPIFQIDDQGGPEGDVSGSYRPPPGPPHGGHFSEPTVLVPRSGGRPRWIAPIAMIVIGVIGATVFGALSVIKARGDAQEASDERDAVVAERDDLASERATLVNERDEAVARADAADEKLGELTDQLAAAEKIASRVEKAAAKKDAKLDALEKTLRAVAKDADAELVREGDQLVVRIADKTLFRSGEAEISRRGKRALRKLGAALEKASDRQIWVQGHADSAGGRGAKFDNNWELSAARALSVVRYLEDKSDIAGKRLAVVAFSRYRPVSRRKKAQNRRIEIVIAPRGRSPGD